MKAFERGEGSGEAARDGVTVSAVSPGKSSRTEAVTASGLMGVEPGRAAPGPGKHTLTQELRPLRAAGKGGGMSLPPAVRARMEAAFGVDFSLVRVHEDALAGEMNAQAFAQGTDLHFAPGTYDPASEQGLALLGHELTHVVQQAEAGGAEVRQAKRRVAHDDGVLEREADVLGAAAARGERISHVSPGAGLDGTVQRKLTVNPVASVRKPKVDVIGDGTPANQGLTIADLNAYVTAQADWFSEPSFTQPDRDAVWRLLLMLKEGAHMVVALGAFHAGTVVALAAPDLVKLKKYAGCFDAAKETVQLTTPVTTMARAFQLGQAILDIEGFAPTPVLRVVIPASGLNYLVDKGKIPELKKYYQLFKPTLESPDEWPHIEQLLTETVGKYAALTGWVRDLHIFTVPARGRLLTNIADKSRSQPVLLILFSASDWNTAFLQAANLEAAILNGKNLALVIQGATSLAAATAEVTRVANDYGQRSWTWDWSSWSRVYTPGRLGQVVFAGHGSDQSVEMTSPGTGAAAQDNNRYVSYDQAPLDSSDPKKNGTELLIDTVLSRMDPKDANVVFAGCLVGSHEIPPSTNVGNGATAQANLQAALAAHPNLADYVRQRMAAKGITGTVQAANGSTTFDSFNVDPTTGRARLSNPGDPDISGTKLQYVRTGIEPEGALRAALECYADPAIGPAKITTEIRTRVGGLAANKGWWETITRVGFELSLPPAGDVDPAKLLDIVHRISAWFFGGWANMIDVQNMANQVNASEAPTVFPAMLSSNWATADHLQVGVSEAWMQHDAAKVAQFMAALTASSLKRETFQPLLARGIVDPKLATLLPVGAPTKGQLILALTIAVKDGIAMPAPVRTFLRAAAGGKTTTTFPPGFGVGPLIAPTGELSVLESIGLAPTSAPPPTASGGASTVDGNVDANHDNKNETYITVSPREATVTAAKLNVRSRPTTASTVIDILSAGTTLRVMGQTQDGWSFIDHQGKTGFVSTTYLSS